MQGWRARQACITDEDKHCIRRKHTSHSAQNCHDQTKTIQLLQYARYVPRLPLRLDMLLRRKPALRR